MPYLASRSWEISSWRNQLHNMTKHSTERPAAPRAGLGQERITTDEGSVPANLATALAIVLAWPAAMWLIYLLAGGAS